MEVLVIVFLILLTGIFVLCEMALVTAKRNKLESESLRGSIHAKNAIKLLDKPEQFKTTLQLSITLCSVLVGAYSAQALHPYFAPFFEGLTWLGNYRDEAAFLTIVFLVASSLIVLGEFIPKTIAANYAEPLALFFAPFIFAATKLTAPFAFVLRWISDLILRLFRMKTINPSAVSEDELRLMINQANEQGIIEKKEGEFMQNILRFADKDAYTLMTSRSEICWLNVRSPHAENAKIVRESGYTKFLVCDDSLDNILGVIRLRDFIENENNKRMDLRKLVHKPIFIPESMNAIKILELFRKKRNYFAIVVDEFSSTQGIITLHDLTENIFGDLPDHDDDDDPPVVVRTDGSLLVDGMITVEELSHRVPIAEFGDNDGDYTTLAGYILSKLEQMPKAGEVLESDGYRFEIMDMDKSRIDKVLINRLE